MTTNLEQKSDATLQALEQQTIDLDLQINALKGQVLDEKEKQEKLKKLEDEKVAVKNKILEQNANKETSLKQDVEKSNNPNPVASEIIKTTWLYTKLQETFKDDSLYPELNWNIEAKINKFSEQINTTVQKYLESIFLDQNEKKFPPAALASMNTWIQFLLMDALKDSNNNAKFFDSFGKVNTSWFKPLFDWLLKTFTKWWEFLSKWKKITKTIDFLSLQPTLRDNAEKIPQLMNPYKFIELANNQKLQWAKDIFTLSLSDLGIWEWTADAIKMTDKERDSLKSIAEKSAIKNDPKTIKWIINALGTAGSFLEKRKDLAEWALSMMDRADWMIAPFEKLLWINMFDMLKPFKWVLNMLLSLLWFSWWLEGLQKRWLLRKLNWQLDTQEKKDFITDSMSYFKDNISKSTVKDTDPESVISIYNSAITSMPADIKAKIPLDYNIICNGIKNNLKNPEIINPLVLQEMGWNRTSMILETTGSNWEKTYKVDKSQFAGKEDDFIKAYTDVIIPKLASDKKFMKDIVWQDEFCLAIMGWVLVNHKNIMESIKAKAIIPSQYLNKPKPETTDNKPELNPDAQNQTDILNENLTRDKLVFIEKVKDNKEEFWKKILDISNYLWINANRLMLMIDHESQFKHDITNGIWAYWLIQFISSTRVWLIDKYNKKNNKTMTDADFKSLSNVQQLDFVKLYYESYKWQIKSFMDLALITWFPAALDKWDDYIWQAGWLSAETIATQNRGMDFDKNGKITNGDVKKHYKNIISQTVDTTNQKYFQNEMLA